MKKSKIGKIVKYNLEKNLRNKWFIGLNVLFLVISIVTLNFGTIKNILKNNNIIPEDKKIIIEVLDETDKLKDKLVESANNNIINNIEINEIDSLNYDETMPEDKIIIEVKNSDTNIIDVKVISKDGIDQKYYSIIEKSLEKVKDEIISDRYDLTQEEVQVLKQNVTIERIMVGVDSSNSDIKQISQTVVNYLTLIILMLILSKIATDISQEKVTKSIEYVLTSISAKDYLIAKVISINLTMIIQLIFTVIYFIIAASINSILTMSSNIVDNVSSFSITNIANLIDGQMVLYIGIVLIFLILTVLLMCIIQAALTSRTTNISEAGNTTTILLTLVFVLYFVSTLIITPLKESSIVIYILSCIPIVSMYFVPSMIIIGQANAIQIVIATLLLIVSIPVSLKICSKVFKDGVLDNFSKKKKYVKEKEDNLKEKEINKVTRHEITKYGYVIGMSVILYVAVQLLLTYVLSLFISPISNATGISIDIISMIVNIIVFILSLLVPTMFVRSYIDNDNGNVSNKKLDIKSILKLVLMSVPIVAIVQIALSYLLEKLGLNYDIVDKINIYSNTSVISSILFFIYIAVLPAIFEELYVRKSVLKFSQKYGNVFAIVSTSILFGVLHMNVSQSLFAFIMGVILAVIAIYSNSIIPTGIIHLLNNGYAALTIIFENNEFVLTIINAVYLLMIIAGIILIIMTAIKNKNNIKEIIINLKENKRNKIKNDYKYIALDYTFILSCILMIVMLILTQKTISIL